ncbi:hypothetical protein GC197_17530 [bacterium]|nr:hypothetical protein [bacterium]
MTAKPELLDAPSNLPAVTDSPPLPVERTSNGGVNPIVRGAANSHLVIWTMLLTMGPFALPLMWISPKYSRWMKILVTSVMVFLTIAFPIGVVIFLIMLLNPIIDAWSQANAMGGA